MRRLLAAWINASLVAHSRSYSLLSRRDARAAFIALSCDERGVLWVWDMCFTGAGGEWIMTSADPDFYQRFVGTVSADGTRIDTHPDASEDKGTTWRKDFDLTFERHA